MLHKPWAFTKQLVDRMADSSIRDRGFTVQRSSPRSLGLHASTLLKQLHPVGGNEMAEDQLRLYGLLGLAFEDRAEQALLTLNDDSDWPFRSFRPGEVTAHGVACSPDILMVPKDDEMEPFELSLKCKWRSSRGLPTTEEGEDGFPAKWNYELSQCATYALPLGTNKAVLLVYFVCGSWKPPVPQVHAWELSFSEQEISETWDALLMIAMDNR